MAHVPVSGNDGRVKKTGGNPIAGLNKWEVVKATKKVVYVHFESDTDADSNVWENVLRGTSSATGTASGQINTNPTDSTDSGTPGLTNGVFVELDLILVKNTPWGIMGVPVFVDQVTIGTNIGSTEPASFAMQFTVDGACGKTGLS